jgi:hypothetical protein
MSVGAAVLRPHTREGDSIMAKGQVRANKEKKKPKADKKEKTTVSAYKAAQQQGKKA